MTRDVSRGRVMLGDFSHHLRSDLIAHKESKGLKEKPHLANGKLLPRIAYQALDMIDELPKAVSQEKVSHEIGPMKIRPLSMIIPPREKSKRTLYKGNKPVRGTEEPVVRAEQMEEEPSQPPLSEAHKRMKAEKVYEAIQRVRKKQAQALSTKEKKIW